MIRMEFLVACAGFCFFSAAALAATLSLRTDGPLLQFQNGDTTVAEYAHGDVPFKPYMKTLRTPAGVQVLRDAPHDHLHHHALMYAIGINEKSYWSEEETAGHQVHQDFSYPAPTESRVGFIQQLDWKPGLTEKAQLKETRSVGLLHGEKLDATLMDWETALVAQEAVQLTGSHYYGLGVRFIEAMDQNGRFLYADGTPGEIVRGDERNTPGPWCAYQVEADGKPITVALFAHPENTHPTLWFTMGDATKNFAYLSATLHLYKKPIDLKKGDTLRQRYGVALWDGLRSPEEIRALKAWWEKQALK
jgi:hypothetical protein